MCGAQSRMRSPATQSDAVVRNDRGTPAEPIVFAANRDKLGVYLFLETVPIDQQQAEAERWASIVDYVVWVDGRPVRPGGGASNGSTTSWGNCAARGW